MLSGIGPEDQLAPFGIELREALPVGENLQDHCMAQLNYLTDEPSLFGCATPENIELLETEGRGPLTSNIPEAAGFFRSRPGLEAPDVEFHFAPVDVLRRGADGAVGSRLLLRAGRDQADEPRPGDAAHAAARLQAARAVQLPDDRRGPRKHDRRHADGARDRRAGAAAQAVERAPFSVPASDSDGDMMAFIERAAQSVYHPTSTCAIGAVVDSELRVYGVDGLRVVDASVMPTITRGNTNAPTIMIAEKAADLITASTGAPATAGVA